MTSIPARLAKLERATTPEGKVIQVSRIVFYGIGFADVVRAEPFTDGRDGRKHYTEEQLARLEASGARVLKTTLYMPQKNEVPE